MANYNPIYTLTFFDFLNRKKKVTIEQDGYEGEVVNEVIGSGSSPLFISLQNPGDPKYQTVKATEIEFKVHSKSRFDYSHIANATDREYRMKVEEAPTENGQLSLKHIGFVIPEIFSETYGKAPYAVSIRAASMGLLNTERYKPGNEYGEYDFDEYSSAGEFYTGKVSLMTILTRCLKKLGYSIDIWDSLNTHESRALPTDDSPLNYIKKDQEDFLIEDDGRTRAMTCIEVIENILKPFVCNFFMDYGRWVICPIELRATNREVRIYNENGVLQQATIFNPLNKKVRWVQDGVLDNLPILRDIESLYEHGSNPEMIIRGNFDTPFVTRAHSFETELIPDIRWRTNDISDFNNFENDPTTGEPPTEPLLDIDGLKWHWNVHADIVSPTPPELVSEGAYYEYTGGVFQFGDNNISVVLKFSFRINTNRVSEQDDVEQKIQFRIGSYYLTAEGTWTTTPSDILIETISDTTIGYNFTQMEFASDNLPSGAEGGEIVARIYRPTNTNGSRVPDVIFSEYRHFTVDFLVNGEDKESTLFFSEREVDVYSDEADYDLLSGDGPTNLHLSSFFIDTEYGDNLITENWKRLNYEGEISEIVVNILALEYFTNSQIIRGGTHRASRLFDRWIIESQKGVLYAFTPLAGTYDERRCEFSGEMVEVLNAEPDVWGTEELEPGPNFAVTLATEPGEAGQDKMWFIESDNAGDIYFVRLQFSLVDGTTVSYTAKKLNADLDQTVPSTDVEDYRTFEREDGGVVIFAKGESGGNSSFTYYLLDESVNLIGSVTSGASNETSYPKRNTYFTVTYDEDENIYLAMPTGTQDNWKIHKYNSSLVEQWQSATFDNGRSIYLKAHRTNVVAVYGNAGTAVNVYAASVNRETGATVNQITLKSGGDGNAGLNTEVGGNSLVPIDDGKLMLNLDGASINPLGNAGRIYTMTEDLATISYRPVDYYGPDPDVSPSELLQGRGLMDVTTDGKILFARPFEANHGVVELDIATETLGTVYSLTSHLDDIIEQIQQTEDGYWFLCSYDTGGSPQDKILYDPATSSLVTGISGVGPGAPGPEFGHSMRWDWQLKSFNEVQPGTPNIENVTLTATPQTATVPFNSLITFGADNTGDANVTINLVIDGVVETSLEIPAGGSASFAVSKGFPNPGSFLVEFAGESLTITANGDDVTGDFEGWIDINSAATDDTDPVAPTDDVYVTSAASSSSSCPAFEFGVQWKGTQYCIAISAGSKEGVYLPLTTNVNSSVPGLSAAHIGASPSGFPTVRFTSDIEGTDDNGEAVILLVQTSIEQNGLIFNKYTLTLTGGVDGYIVNEQIDILIGGSVFATTSAVTALETADSIAQKVYDACVAVGDPDYTFAKNGTRVLVGGISAQTLDLDIKNAGFSYSTQDLEAV